MNKSIEQIWKDGFIESDALVAPRINDLYNQKSENMVDKFKRMFDLNLKGIAIGAVVILVASIAFGFPFLGLFIALSLMSLVRLGYQKLQALKLVDKNVTSYEYLISFNSWLKGTIADFTRIYTVFYPVLFLAIAIRLAATDVASTIYVGMAKDFPSIPVIFGIPVVLPVVVLFIAGLLAYFAPAIYRIDMNSLYGHEFKKLDELLADMKTLVNE